MYNTNNSGPIKELCGTPDATGKCVNTLPYMISDYTDIVDLYVFSISY